MLVDATGEFLSFSSYSTHKYVQGARCYPFSIRDILERKKYTKGQSLIKRAKSHIELPQFEFLRQISDLS